MRFEWIEGWGDATRHHILRLKKGDAGRDRHLFRGLGSCLSVHACSLIASWPGNYSVQNARQRRGELGYEVYELLNRMEFFTSGLIIWTNLVTGKS